MLSSTPMPNMKSGRGGKGDSNSVSDAAEQDVTEAPQLSDSSITSSITSSTGSNSINIESSSPDSISCRGYSDCFDSPGSYAVVSENVSVEDVKEDSKKDSFVSHANTTGKKANNKKTLSKNESSTYKWNKPIPRKKVAPTTQTLKPHCTSMARDATQRTLSARLHKIKGLRNEINDLQLSLETVSVENKILKRLQHRYAKALEKFESAENDVQQIITQHNGEVRTLRQLLRNSQEQERSLTRKLRETEMELLRVKDTMRKLQKLSEDKNLAEREELSNRLSNLVEKQEESNEKIKILKRQLHLDTTCYNRHLAAEFKKTAEARELNKKLQTEIGFLHQKIKEQERELNIKNIYANRMPKDLFKYEHLHCQKGLALTVSTQTEMFIQPQINEQHDDYIVLQKRENEKEDVVDTSQIDEDASPASGELQEHETLKNPKLLKEAEEMDKKLFDTFLNDVREDGIDKLETSFQEQSLNDESTKIEKSLTTESSKKMDRQLFSPRLRKHKFTVATENLHQGFAAMGRIQGSRNYRNHKPLDEAVGLNMLNEQYEPSFVKAENSKQNEAKEDTNVKDSNSSLKEKKHRLMEELFGPGYSMKNNFSGQMSTSKNDDDFLESEYLQASQKKNRSPKMH